MDMEEFTQNAIQDRLEGWELVEFLQISVEDVIQAALEFDWINDDNVEDLLEFVGIKK